MKRIRPKRQHSTPQIRTAAVEHRCTQRGYHIIAPGERYLYIAGAPWSDWNSARKWFVIKACLFCADREGLHTAETRLKVASD